MIEPHTLQGGASSWFCMAAAAYDGGGAGFAVVAAAALTDWPAEDWVSWSSRLFTPAWNCASGDRNFVASHRKM